VKQLVVIYGAAPKYFMAIYNIIVEKRIMGSNTRNKLNNNNDKQDKYYTNSIE